MLISYLFPKGLDAPEQCCVLLILHFLNVFGFTLCIILRQAEYVNTEICNFLHCLVFGNSQFCLVFFPLRAGPTEGLYTHSHST
jgi:hypothetical protein